MENPLQMDVMLPSRGCGRASMYLLGAGAGLDAAAAAPFCPHGAHGPGVLLDRGGTSLMVPAQPEFLLVAVPCSRLCLRVSTWFRVNRMKREMT